MHRATSNRLVLAVVLLCTTCTVACHEDDQHKEICLELCAGLKSTAVDYRNGMHGLYSRLDQTLGYLTQLEQIERRLASSTAKPTDAQYRVDLQRTLLINAGRIEASSRAVRRKAMQLTNNSGRLVRLKLVAYGPGATQINLAVRELARAAAPTALGKISELKISAATYAPLARQTRAAHAVSRAMVRQIRAACPMACSERRQPPPALEPGPK